MLTWRTEAYAAAHKVSPCHAVSASIFAAHLPEAADDGARAVLAAVAMDEKRVVPRVEDVCECLVDDLLGDVDKRLLVARHAELRC